MALDVLRVQKKFQTLLPDIIAAPHHTPHTTPHRGLKKNKTSYLPTVPKNTVFVPKSPSFHIYYSSSYPYYCTGIWAPINMHKSLNTHTANSIMGTLQNSKTPVGQRSQKTEVGDLKFLRGDRFCCTCPKWGPQTHLFLTGNNT